MSLLDADSVPGLPSAWYQGSQKLQLRRPFSWAGGASLSRGSSRHVRLRSSEKSRYPHTDDLWRYDASSTSCAPLLGKILMNTLKASLMDMGKFPPKA